jgi:HEAT repeat protein
MDIDKLVNEIIPSVVDRLRNDSNNIPIIDALTREQRKLVEQALIKKLELQKPEEVDTLIVETLGYLKSAAAVTLLKNLLDAGNNYVIKLRIATAIFEIEKDEAMIDIAIRSVKQIDNKNDAHYKYKLPSALYYLAKFKNEKTNQILQDYISDPDYIISYNAKRYLILARSGGVF